ncbi:hypothetical protein AB0L44_15390 [Nonomuraea wenchangensis]|uniref:hypothetical protein n=1 Tax=Nonomuraea wenchangensis TaxID=568860 RepID=UPI00342927BA
MSCQAPPDQRRIRERLPLRTYTACRPTATSAPAGPMSRHVWSATPLSASVRMRSRERDGSAENRPARPPHSSAASPAAYAQIGQGSVRSSGCQRLTRVRSGVRPYRSSPVSANDAPAVPIRCQVKGSPV